MFPGCCGLTLASMSQTDWSDLGMTDLLPTGMVTLLLADVEGSTRLWESQSKEMAAGRPCCLGVGARARDSSAADLPRPERVIQLCHPDLAMSFRR